MKVLHSSLLFAISPQLCIVFQYSGMTALYSDFRLFNLTVIGSMFITYEMCSMILSIAPKPSRVPRNILRNSWTCSNKYKYETVIGKIYFVCIQKKSALYWLSISWWKTLELMTRTYSISSVILIFTMYFKKKSKRIHDLIVTYTQLILRYESASKLRSGFFSKTMHFCSLHDNKQVVANEIFYPNVMYHDFCQNTIEKHKNFRISMGR